MRKRRKKIREIAFGGTVIPTFVPGVFVIEKRKEVPVTHNLSRESSIPPKSLYVPEDFFTEVRRIRELMAMFEKAKRFVANNEGDRARIAANLLNARQLVIDYENALKIHDAEVSGAQAVLDDTAYKSAQEQLAELRAAAKKLLETLD
jgi:hypothetical protein